MARRKDKAYMVPAKPKKLLVQMKTLHIAAVCLMSFLHTPGQNPSIKKRFASRSWKEWVSYHVAPFKHTSFPRKENKTDDAPL